MDINKVFDEFLDITTADGKKYHIECKNVLICDTQTLYGKINVLEKDNTLYIIKEVYSFENNIARGSYIKIENPKAYNTIEKHDDGSETPIYVIESFDSKKTYIGSIRNIKTINSDKIEKINNKYKEQPLILKLLRRNKNGEVIQDLLAA